MEKALGVIVTGKDTTVPWKNLMRGERAEDGWQGATHLLES